MTDSAPTPESPASPLSSVSTNTALLRWLSLVAVTFVLLVLSFVWLARSLTIHSPSEAAKKTLPPPDFRLASLDGRTLGPADFSDQVIILDFWATWCGPCKLQARILEELHDELKAKNVQVLAINVGEDVEKVRRYVERSPFPYPVLLDESEELMGTYRIGGLPTLMIIDRQGEVSYMRVGVTDPVTIQSEVAKAGAV
jgi:thiol-disulfide isomerase/thioredoxin